MADETNTTVSENIDTAKQFLQPLGEQVSSVFSNIISFVANLGLNISEIQTKLISLVILLIGFFITIKFVNVANKFIKWGILALIGILILSIIFSF